MTELLYTVMKCKKMTDELSYFILSIRACGTGPASTQSMCVGVERVSSERGGAGRGACVRWCEARLGGGRGAQCGRAGGGWMAQSVDSLVGSTSRSR
jgi:hypothetical protein